jgi:hypothetical protein
VNDKKDKGEEGESAYKLVAEGQLADYQVLMMR